MVFTKEEYSKHHQGGYLVQKRFLMKFLRQHAKKWPKGITLRFEKGDMKDSAPDKWLQTAN